MSWASQTDSLGNQVASLFAHDSIKASSEMATLMQADIDKLKLLTFSNAIMMETAPSNCILKLIDVVYDAVNPSACSIFVMEEDMQNLKEFTHNVYMAKTNKPRIMSARSGIGRKVRRRSKIVTSSTHS